MFRKALCGIRCHPVEQCHGEHLPLSAQSCVMLLSFPYGNVNVMTGKLTKQQAFALLVPALQAF